MKRELRAPKNTYLTQGVSGDSAAKKYNEEKVLRLQKQNTELLGYVRKGQKAEGREQGEMSVKLAKILANSEKGGGNTGSESGAPKKKNNERQ